MEPRPYQDRHYQERAERVILDYFEARPQGSLLAVAPPGSGKTKMAARLLREMASDGKRGLALAHRRELVGQHRDHLVRCGMPEDMLGVIMANDQRVMPDAPIQVASVDTLRHRDKPPADFIVWDEGHRDASDGRRALRELYPAAAHLGLTATPIRTDGRSLEAEYDDLYVIAQPSEILAGGWIKAPKMYIARECLMPTGNTIVRRPSDRRSQ